MRFLIFGIFQNKQLHWDASYSNTTILLCLPQLLIFPFFAMKKLVKEKKFKHFSTFAGL